MLQGTDDDHPPRIRFHERDGALTASFVPFITDREKRLRSEERRRGARFAGPNGVVGDCDDELKSEMGRYLEGYPPFYKNTFLLPSGTAVLYPIQDYRDIERGGWVIAAGLSRNRRRLLTALGVYSARNETALWGEAALWRECGRISRYPASQALVQAKDTLLKLFLPPFP